MNIPPREWCDDGLALGEPGTESGRLGMNDVWNRVSMDMLL